MTLGGIKIGRWIVLAALLLAAHLGWILIPPWLDFYRFQDHLRVKARTAQGTSTAELSAELYRAAAEWNIPVDPEKNPVRIEGGQNGLQLSADWEVEVKILGRYPRVLRFHATSE